MNALINLLNAILPVSRELQSHLTRVLQTRTFAKRTFLLTAGEISNHIYFIESGLTRCFYLKDGLEVCSWFMKEHDVILSVQSFFHQKASYENIQALENTTVHYLTYQQLQFIYENFPEFNAIGRILTERYYALSEHRLYSLRMMRGHERYKVLVENYPDLIQRVSSVHLASYLGITKETLSRIRRQLSTAR